jgi:glycosyltransferase involved in cell wall biosynthesis
MPHDPASGAARSTRTICEMLAAGGFAVRAVGTTATERQSKTDPLEFLRSLGIRLKVDPGHTKARVRPEISFEHRSIQYRLLDVGNRSMHGWQEIQGKQFDQIFDDEIHTFRPDLLLTYGGLPGDVKRHQRARRQGVRIVFALRNDGYLQRGFFDDMDGVVTPSQFLTDFYRGAIGLESTPLPLPIELEDVVAEDHDPIFFTMINPSPEKGLMVLARLAEELSIQRPDIPLLVIESRGSAGRVVQAGLTAGFDLRRHENLMLSPALPKPKDIYVATRALLVPSLWQEPAGRIVVEALLNGIPPIVSDRGGLAETCNGGGFIIPMLPGVTRDTPRPVDFEVVEPWIELIIRLEGDPDFYRAESERALGAGMMYRPERLAPRYVEYFLGIMNA